MAPALMETTMPDELRIQRTIIITKTHANGIREHRQIEISGPAPLVNEEATKVVMSVDGEHWKIEQRTDLLDDNWVVIDPHLIVTAALKMQGEVEP